MSDYFGFFIEKNTHRIEDLRKTTDSFHVQNERMLLQIDGRQNYYYSDNQVEICFHGECYNEEKLKEKYEEHTESIAETIGVLFKKVSTDLFHHIRGKFSIVIWDKNNDTLYGVRDHFGVKTLFYNEMDEGILFSSTKKRITSYIEDVVNEEALQHYLSFQFIPNPMTLSEGIKHVPPGSYFMKKQDEPLHFIRYFQPTFNPMLTEKSVWINKIRDVLFESVETHMQGESSIGSFLSGGIDSTFIASIAKQYKPDLKTFSVGFAREGFSEIDVAKETADKLGVENISRIISPEEYVEKLPEIMWHLEDPLADPSCVPLYFVANEAKKHVDFSLSGEGADELFGGYNIYREPDSLKIFDYIPSFVKGVAAKIATTLPENIKGKSFLERGTTPLKDRYIGNAKMFEEDEKEAILRRYDETISYQDITHPLFNDVPFEPLVTQMQYIDINTWLPGDILLKARKMTNANNLEVRMPFLDKNVFQLASKLPVNVTIAEGTTKHILREAARGIIPNHVLDRKKLGFPVPIRHWLKNELNSWAKKLINESETEAYLHKSYVLDLLNAHCHGQADYSRKIWTLLMFMLWHQVFVEKRYHFSE